MNGCSSETPSGLSIAMLAANSMYRICQSILTDHLCKVGENSEMLFEMLSVMISDIFSASVINLKHVISKHCNCIFNGSQKSAFCMFAYKEGLYDRKNTNIS